MARRTHKSSIPPSTAVTAVNGDKPGPAASVAAPAEDGSPKPYKAAYFNRELSWLAFDRRVLELAQNERIPLLERVKFLAIVSSNL
ncbi:MAG TPA: hypothetical protein VNV15_01565, partial [Opitutaceae bacterium]|nr:hypothetical protein [Opitutaceae bacterium]